MHAWLSRVSPILDMEGIVASWILQVSPWAWFCWMYFHASNFSISQIVSVTLSPGQRWHLAQFQVLCLLRPLNQLKAVRVLFCRGMKCQKRYHLHWFTLGICTSYPLPPFPRTLVASGNLLYLTHLARITITRQPIKTHRTFMKLIQWPVDSPCFHRIASV